MRDRKTGEDIRPFGYDLDDAGRPIRGKVTLSRAQYAEKYGLALCASCEALLNSAGDCDDCASARQGNI